MAKNLRDRILGDSVWRTLLIAIAVLVAGQWILVWQYQRIEGERVRELEQKVEQQQQTIEERAAQEALRIFFEARVAGDEARAFRYVTEQAAFERQQGAFVFERVENYEIQEKENIGEGAFRFRVELTRDRLRQGEIIDVLKIGDIYYVDSVQPAG